MVWSTTARLPTENPLVGKHLEERGKVKSVAPIYLFIIILYNVCLYGRMIIIIIILLLLLLSVLFRKV